MTPDSLLYQLAVDLNDAGAGHEFTTWSAEQLGAYLMEAIQVAFVERPDLFIEHRIIHLKPCSIIQDTCDCTHVIRVLGQSTADGRVFKELRVRKANDKLLWTGRTCKSKTGKFELIEYTIDSNTDTLRVYPQVPAGQDIYVLVECSVIPKDIGDVVDTELLAAIKQWVLYRAKTVDAELNPNIFNVAKLHRDTFFALLAIQKENNDQKAEDADNARQSSNVRAVQQS